jgi:hypothetical protein
MALSEIFYNSVLITSSGIVLAILGVCYKSKCRHIKCWGIEIERDTQAEEEIDLELQENKNNVE